jgi:hypothetical protein
LDIVHLLRLTRLSEAEFASVIRFKEGKNPAQLGLLGRDILEHWVKKEVLGKTNALLQKNIMCVLGAGGTGASANQSLCIVLFPTCGSVSLTWYLAVADSVCPLKLLSLPCDIRAVDLPSGPNWTGLFLSLLLMKKTNLYSET